jgi:hypothetical protein
MREITTKVYTFDELPDKVKEKARDWYRQGIDYEWWDSAYADAENVGIEIQYFDLDRMTCTGKFIEGAEYTADQILSHHGDLTYTRELAEQFLERRNLIIDEAPRDEGGFTDTLALDSALNALEKEFLRGLLTEYMSLLGKEWEYINSDEAVDRIIIANDYEFTEDGKIA